MFGTLHRIRLARRVNHATLKAFLPRQRAFMQQTGVAFVPVVSSDRADATFVGCVYFHLLEDVLHEFEELEAHRLTLTHTLTLSLTLTLTLSLSLALTLTCYLYPIPCPLPWPGVLLNERTLTSERVEVTLACHLLFGTYLLGKLALPALEATPGSLTPSCSRSPAPLP